MCKYIYYIFGLGAILFNFIAVSIMELSVYKPFWQEGREYELSF